MPSHDWFKKSAKDPFAAAYARRGDPETSHDAAGKVDASLLEGLVTQELRKRWPNGLTTHELEDLLHIQWGSITPRMRPLVRKKLAMEDGSTRVPHGHKRRQLIWWAANWGIGVHLRRRTDTPPKPEDTTEAKKNARPWRQKC